jgi:predicted HD phosphohydrolase
MHFCRVSAIVSRNEPRDQDLIVAALLHDIGKASHCGRVRLTDRIIHVLLARFAVSIVLRLTERSAPR